MQEIISDMIRLVQPSEINTRRPLHGVFNDSETEESARRIVQFCQQRESWTPFSRADLNVFCKSTSSFSFGKLVVDEYVVIRDGVCTLTVEFVALCSKRRRR